MSEKILVGEILEGKIIKIKPFGAIVLVKNNLQGLVHISHISDKYVQNVEEYISVGDVVKVKVLLFDENEKKLSLSIKDALLSKTSKNKSSSDIKKQDNNFEDKLKEWVKNSNENQAILNKRNKKG